MPGTRGVARGLCMVVSTAIASLVAVPTVDALPGDTGPRRCRVDGAEVHTVVVGDTWFGIAEDAGVSLRAVLVANDAEDTDVIRPGDEVCVPNGSNAPTTTATTSPSDAATTTTTPPAVPLASCPSGNPTHTVIVDDSWFFIAKRAKVAMKDVLAVNGASEDTPLHPGDIVCLPLAATPASTTTAPTTTTAPAAPSTTTPKQTGRTCTRGDAATHTVVVDESWFMIAQKSGSTLKALLAANDATAATTLFPGDVICLAAASSGGTASVAPVAGMTAPPVQGPCDYTDTFRAPRGGGRRHEGVDLMAKSGRYIYAVADGTLTKRAWDQPGLRAGNAWWLTAADGSGTYYFYAHLLDFTPGLKVGSRVQAGDVIGFIGETGNAGGPHLHFEVHPGGGSAVNPYPLVKALGTCKG